MTIGYDWWYRTVSAVRYLDSVMDSISAGRSAAMIFPEKIPWEQDFVGAIRDRLRMYLDTRWLEVQSAAGVDSPGKFLMRSYLSKEDQELYWPPRHGSEAHFLGMSEHSPLHRRFLLLTDISAGKAPLWGAAVREYQEGFRAKFGENADCCIFILIIKCGFMQSAPELDVCRYSDYITDYDSLMFSMMRCSALQLSSGCRQYIAELASSLGDQQIELAGELAGYGEDLAKHPWRCAQEVFDRRGELYTEDRIRNAIWLAQIKVVYPKLEEERRGFITKYQKKLAAYMPLPNSLGEIITKPADLEIGQLFFIVNKHKFAGSDDFHRISSLRDVRNQLAHSSPMSYDMLTALNLV